MVNATRDSVATTALTEPKQKVSAQVRNDLPLAETKTSIATTEKEHSPTVIAAPIPAVNVWRVRKSTKTCDNENKTSGADMTTDAPAPLTDDAAWPAPQEVLEEGQQQQQPKFVIPKGKKSQWKPYTPTITHSTPTPTGLRLRTAASRGRGQGERRKTRRNSHPGLRQQADESVAPGSLSATMARAETSTTTAPPPASIAVNVKPAAAASTPTTTSSTSTASITHSPSRASHSTPVIYSQLNTGERGTGYAGGRSGSSRGRGNGRGTYRRYNEHRIKPQLMNMDADTLKHYLLQQIEYYFSIDNLCKDLFLRRQMDDQGFVDIRIIAGFNRIKSLTTELQLIREALQDSQLLEVKDDKLRKREGWQTWLLLPLPPKSAAEAHVSVDRTQAPAIAVSSMLTATSERLGERLECSTVKN